MDNRSNVQAIASKQDSFSWYWRMVERGRFQPFAELATITPDIAEIMLNNNPQNRPYKKTVEQIADDIRNGRWSVNGETIIISKEGLLNDGQNRLAAVVVSDIPVQMLVYFGAERDSRLTVDMGVVRTNGDFITMSGAANGNSCASVSKLLALYSKGAMFERPPGLSKQFLLAFYRQNKSDIDTAIHAIAGKKFCLRVGITPVVTAYVILTRHNPESAPVFFDSLLSGENLSAGNAILQAREHLLDSGRQRLRAWEKLELILRYWNAWRQRKRLTRNYAISHEYPRLED